VRRTGTAQILHGASTTLSSILLGVGGTIYNNHMLEPVEEPGLESQTLKKLASKLHVHLVNLVNQAPCPFCQPRCLTCLCLLCPFQCCALSSTISTQLSPGAKPVTHLKPIDFPFIGGNLYIARVKIKRHLMA